MVAYFLWSFADSTDEVVKQHAGHMVAGWRHAVVSQLRINRVKNKSFYVVAEVELNLLRSGCSVAVWTPLSAMEGL